MCHLPPVSFDHTWLSRRIPLGRTPTSLTYFDPKNVYVAAVVGTTKPEFDDEEYQTEEGYVDESLLPDVEAGQLVMVSPLTYAPTDR